MSALLHAPSHLSTSSKKPRTLTQSMLSNMLLLRTRLLSLHTPSIFSSPPLPSSFLVSFPKPFSHTFHRIPNRQSSTHTVSASNTTNQPPSQTDKLIQRTIFIPPGVEPNEVTEKMILPGSNIVIGPYAGHSQIKEVEFIKSSGKAKECPKFGLPEFAVLGRSNVGKSSLINTLVRKKEVALTSKKPGKTQLINHFLVNKSWYIVDLPGYGFANAPESTRTDWASFTKGYFLNRETLVAVLLLVDASIPPRKIDLDCANWLGRNNIPMTFVFTKCDKMKAKKGNRPDENIKNFQELIRKNYREPPPWIMTSSVTGLGRDELLLHMSQLRNFWDN